MHWRSMQALPAGVARILLTVRRDGISEQFASTPAGRSMRQEHLSAEEGEEDPGFGSFSLALASRRPPKATLSLRSSSPLVRTAPASISFYITAVWICVTTTPA